MKGNQRVVSTSHNFSLYSTLFSEAPFMQSHWLETCCCSQEECEVMIYGNDWFMVCWLKGASYFIWAMSTMICKTPPIHNTHLCLHIDRKRIVEIVQTISKGRQIDTYAFYVSTYHTWGYFKCVCYFCNMKPGEYQSTPSNKHFYTFSCSSQVCMGLPSGAAV